MGIQEKYEIITVTKENIEQYGAPCFLNPKHTAHITKKQWIKTELEHGLTIKHLFVEGEKKAIGFIEYVQGEHAWRAVDAANYIVIHCIWISPNKYKEKGFGSILLQDCIQDAKKQGSLGVISITSDGSFIAGKELFEKNGFKQFDQSDRFELMCYQIKTGKRPQFKELKSSLNELKGLNLLYSDQCPWASRAIVEFEDFLTQQKISYTIKKFDTPFEAQNAPSIYATFNVVYEGKLLVDHYVSLSRFQNILLQANLIHSKIPSTSQVKKKINK